VLGLIERDPKMKIDRLTSAILDYPAGHCIFTCGTQMAPYQRMQILGTRARIEIEIPFNAPPNRACRVFLDDGRDVAGSRIKTYKAPKCDQYTAQGDLFSRAIRSDGEVPVALESSIRNMAVIDAIFRSAESGKWEEPKA
jgi:predicted dehydrogenase